MSNNANVPAWGTDVEELAGVDLVDKSELVGVPFCITALWFAENTRGIEYAYVEGMREDGTVFTFNDSSSGVRTQLETVIRSKGLNVVPTEDAPYELRMVIPRGLRKSVYEVKDERQRTKMATTYYLTTNGVRVPAAAKPVTSNAAKTTKVAK